MEYQGICHKMRARLGETVENTQGHLVAGVEYSLVVEPFESPMNELIGQDVELVWTGQIRCVSCGNKTPKSYSQGHCFKCFKTKASCDMCIMKPETCHFHEGTCREPEWGEQFCFNPHVVYLANSSALKVGITRHNQMPTRWLDQGATQAVPIIQTQSRFLAGVVEVLIAQHMSDKTDWRKMLKGESEPLPLAEIRAEVLAKYGDELKKLQHAYPEQVQVLDQEMIREFSYPVLHYPEKVTAHNFDKTQTITGKLNGIKGQYLLLDSGVLNLRKFTGYELVMRT
jgi:hypothetical protein